MNLELLVKEAKAELQQLAQKRQNELSEIDRLQLELMPLVEQVMNITRRIAELGGNTLAKGDPFLVNVICYRLGIDYQLIMSKARTKGVSRQRWAVMDALRKECWTDQQIADVLHVDRTAVVYGIQKLNQVEAL